MVVEETEGIAGPKIVRFRARCVADEIGGRRNAAYSVLLDGGSCHLPWTAAGLRETERGIPVLRRLNTAPSRFLP